jgi:hypothetical protein
MARLIYNCSFNRTCTTRHRAIWQNSGTDGIILSCENNNHYTLNVVGAPTVAWFNSVTLGESFRPSFTPKGIAIGWGGVLGQCTINATTGALTVNFFSGSPDKIGYLNMDWYNR